MTTTIYRAAQDCGTDSPLEWYDEVTVYTTERYVRYGVKVDSYDEVLHDIGIEEASDLDGYTILPLYKYDHGGVVYSTTPFSCSWDSGQVGWVVLEGTHDNAEKLLGSIIDDFSLWANGDVFLVSEIKQKKCECCDHITEEEIMSTVGNILGYENIELTIRECFGAPEGTTFEME